MNSINNSMKKAVLVAIAAVTLSVSSSFAGWFDPPPPVNRPTAVAAVRG